MLENLLDLPGRIRRAYRRWSVDSRLDRLNSWFDRREPGDAGGQAYDHAETVRDYYDLCHEFMEFGWGESLHFAPLVPGETLEDAVVRHQRLMIRKLELKQGMRVVDVGCGVGGPMRRVAREAGVTVVGVNNNEHQLAQAKSKNVEAGVDHMAEYVRCDFMDMGVLEANAFDAAYAIESTCHAPDKQGAFAEIYRLLKPGALFWGQEMCLTNAFDPSDPNHVSIKEELMRGIALNHIASFEEVDRALEAVGFEVVGAADLGANGGPTASWWGPMESRNGSFGNFILRTPWGRRAMGMAIRLAETARVFPRNSHKVIRFMDRTADAYVHGAKAGIFTPLYCFLARKPVARPAEAEHPPGENATG
ncbi:MAG: class I SAM-dependent methyltransferase [Gammaproteobacteria bacterium]|nr:class I SAM-dependent methyltransferase [Gammaproteobacteria bacterium]